MKDNTVEEINNNNKDHICTEVSVCHYAIENTFFPMLCSACGEFSDQVCKHCHKIMYKLPCIT